MEARKDVSRKQIGWCWIIMSSNCFSVVVGRENASPRSMKKSTGWTPFNQLDTRQTDDDQMYLFFYFPESKSKSLIYLTAKILTLQLGHRISLICGLVSPKTSVSAQKAEKISFLQKDTHHVEQYFDANNFGWYDTSSKEQKQNWENALEGKIMYLYIFNSEMGHEQHEFTAMLKCGSFNNNQYGKMRFTC